MSLILLLGAPAFAKEKTKGASGFPHGFESGERKGWKSDVPPGWERGEKKGWGEERRPPGLLKREKAFARKMAAENGKTKANEKDEKRRKRS